MCSEVRKSGVSVKYNVYNRAPAPPTAAGSAAPSKAGFLQEQEKCCTLAELVAEVSCSLGDSPPT